MKERPILFSAPMVRAILEGRKTQTRRVIKCNLHEFQLWIANQSGKNPNIKNVCPYGEIGDQLWVRETFCLENTYEYHGEIHPPNDRPYKHVIPLHYEEEEYFLIPHYKADGECDILFDDGHGDLKNKWKPSIHMPRWAGRINLLIKNIRIERLQDISEQDALSEGVKDPLIGTEFASPYGADYHAGPCTWFAILWNKINGSNAWAANPWVWVIEFEKAQP